MKESKCHIILSFCLIFQSFLPVKDGANSSTVGAASVDVKTCCQQDTVFYRDRAMRE